MKCAIIKSNDLAKAKKWSARELLSDPTVGKYCVCCNTLLFQATIWEPGSPENGKDCLYCEKCKEFYD